MTRTTYTCTCGAILEFKQDLEKESGIATRSWKCTDCGTPVPSQIGEKVSHQDPS